jgi:hypothetical protein
VQVKRAGKRVLIEDVLVIAGAAFFSPMMEDIGPLPEGDDARVVVDFAWPEESFL